jgi:hypothetical protein
MNYVDVARNIAAGRGITQSTLGFNQAHFPIDDEIPTPLTTQPPLYPLVLAAFTYAGLDAADAALIVAACAYGLVLLVAYLLTSKPYGRDVALLSIALLLVYAPLVTVARAALSETLAMLFLLLGFLFLARGSADTRGRVGVALAAGLFFGLAFVTRYAMAPSLVVGLLALAYSAYRRGDRWQAAASQQVCLVAGFTIPAIPVLAHNIIMTHNIMGSTPLPITLTAYAGLSVTFHSLAGQYLGTDLSERLQELLLGTLLLGVVITLVWRGHLGNGFKRIAFADEGLMLMLWILIYLAFLICQRMRTNFDLDARMVLPAGVMLVLLVAGLAGASLGLHSRCLGYLALALVCVALVREIRLASQPQAPRFEDVIASSERLHWVATQTTSRDLIAGIDTLDIQFYLGRPGVLFFTGLPYAVNAEYDTLMAWVGRHRRQYDRVFFILPRYDKPLAEWQRRYGPFVADLAAGHTDPYPDLRLWCGLADAYVFEVR